MTTHLTDWTSWETTKKAPRKNSNPKRYRFKTKTKERKRLRRLKARLYWLTQREPVQIELWTLSLIQERLKIWEIAK